MGAHKKLQVLSFGDEAAEIEEESQKVNEKIKAKSAHDVAEDKTVVAEEFKPEQKTEEDEKWLSRRVDGDVDLDDVDDLSSWIRTKMKERNEQIEQEDEETKKAKLAERKRKVLSYQEQQKILLRELSDMKKKNVGEGDSCY